MRHADVAQTAVNIDLGRAPGCRGIFISRRLKKLDTRLPLMSDSDRRKMTAYVHLFRSGDFDAIRAMLADDVKLDLVNRLQLEGRDKIGLYFTRYAEETKWRFALGAVEGQPAMLAPARWKDLRILS